MYIRSTKIYLISEDQLSKLDEMLTTMQSLFMEIYANREYEITFREPKIPSTIRDNMDPKMSSRLI